MHDLVKLLTLSDANTRVVLLGAALLGAASGVVGTFAVLRRRALVGDAISHAALPGVCAAYLIAGGRDFATLLLGALVFSLLAVVCLGLIRAHTRIKDDAALALVLATFFGLGIVLSRIIQNAPGGNRAGLDGFIFGKAASMVRQDVVVIAAVAVLAIAFVAILFKELAALSFDRDFTASIGFRTTLLDLSLLATTCAVVVAGLPAVGVVLMVALLVTPAAAARFWTDRLTTMIVLAALFGAASGLVGVSLSAVLPPPSGALSRGWPTGPLIAIVAAGLFGLSFLLAPRRGVFAGWLRRRGVRRSLREGTA